MKDKQTLTNQFLIAMPNLQDPNFYRTVIYICEHNKNGAIGIIINRPTDIKLDIALEQMSIKITHQNARQIPLHIGGPVQTERGFVIHQPHGQWRSSMKTGKCLAVTTSQDILQAIAKGEGPSDIMIALGYTGWGADQLESEVMDNAWLTCPVDEDILFNTPLQLRWKHALTKLGVDADQLSYQAGHA